MSCHVSNATVFFCLFFFLPFCTACSLSTCSLRIRPNSEPNNYCCSSRAPSVRLSWIVPPEPSGSLTKLFIYFCLFIYLSCMSPIGLVVITSMCHFRKSENEAVVGLKPNKSFSPSVQCPVFNIRCKMNR